jgi:glucokinase
MTHYLGIDIGGTKIAAGLVDAHGKVAARLQCLTPTSGGRAILEAAAQLCRELVGSTGHKALAAGVGAGGQIDSTRGVVVSATDVIPGWSGTQIRSILAERIEMPVFADNDVNALAAGEQRFGCAAGCSTVIFLALGTGVGGALLCGERLHHGAHWTGGEFGHILIDISPNARKDMGGAAGTLEAYVSGPGLLQTWREITSETDPHFTAHDVAADAEQDPGGAGALAIRKTGEYLGYGLVSLANALDPDLIVIGGGLAALGDALLEPERAVLRSRALPGPATCAVVPALLGEDASVIGAASLAMM